MPRMELSLDGKYLPEWDVSNGIREFVQNCRDGEVQQGATAKIDWYNDTLRIENTGCVLPREALLFGHTTKQGCSETIGKFGEGLKLGALVLVRNGFPVKIRSGSEVWTPAIERSEKYNANVLVFDIAEGRVFENRIRVEIGNITRERWETLREHFLFLNTEPDDQKIKVRSGTLLLDHKYTGMLFVKGIFVQKTDNTFGYDLADAELDRDRRMVESYDLNSRLSNIWRDVVAAHPSFVSQYLGLIESQAEDVSAVNRYNTSYLSKPILEAAAARFTEEHGANAVPVANIAEAHDIEHLGRTGIVVNTQLGALLEPTFGSLVKMKEALHKETVRSYSWHELTQTEKDTFEIAAGMVVAADESFALADIDCVDFKSPELQGLFKDGRVQIARKHLDDVDTALPILVYEFAHKLGGADGEKSHVANIEKLWSRIVSKLRKGGV